MVIESPDNDPEFISTPCDIEKTIRERQEAAAWDAREKIKALLEAAGR